MAKAIDIGTSFIVGAEIKDGKEVFTSERDAFFSMPKEDFAEEMLADAGARFVTRGNQLFGPATRSDSGACQGALNSH